MTYSLETANILDEYIASIFIAKCKRSKKAAEFSTKIAYNAEDRMHLTYTASYRVCFHMSDETIPLLVFLW
jgi:hypothetical protein